MINIKRYSFAKSLKDLGNEFVCILTGYNDEMDSFLELNPGMPSRFPVHITFTNSIEKAIRVQAVRLMRISEPPREDLVMLRHEDFVL
ncbi:hypothetical protein [Brevibacillus reuszeri]|uniref:hypothetical protein n=1 Tax=Brevibacillus reuszeri TaxID=54915 RepID=UPI002896F760|nr:hypothetical protein [Brevibacillus reuszeri]